ncbi:MAG: beta-lactamase family protein [Alphaproteobacteria bacterium]|nr:beta-lactamase family protein [Alphaproteobacteria bacterium]
MWTLLLACAAPDTDSAEAFDPALAADIQDALDAERRHIDAPGAALAVSLPGQPLGLFASGEADLEAALAVSPDMVFRVGSITKTFVSAALMQEVEAGRVDLDAALSTWLPEAPHADEVSLRQALTHRSGFPDYVETLTFLSELDRRWTPEELLALIADDALLFEPDTGYRYSNTNYVLAGLVLEQVTGQSYTDELHARFIDPLGLESTFLPSADAVTVTQALGYLGEGDDPEEVTEALDASGPWAAGEMVSDVSDLVAWAQALYGGELLGAAALAEVTTPYSEGVEAGAYGPGAYGLGCYIQEVEGFATVGHSGSTLGYEARMRYAETEDGPIVVVTLVNNFLSEADEIDIAVWEILAAR